MGMGMWVTWCGHQNERGWGKCFAPPRRGIERLEKTICPSGNGKTLDVEMQSASSTSGDTPSFSLSYHAGPKTIDARICPPKKRSNFTDLSDRPEMASPTKPTVSRERPRESIKTGQDPL